MKLVTLLIVSFILFASATCAAPYFYSTGLFSSTGGVPNFVAGGIGTFNGQMTSYSIASRSVTATAKGVPLAGDLDGDNVTELVVRDASTIRLYHGTLLSPIYSVSVQSSSALSNVILFDIDGDGNEEIIEAVAPKITIYDFNGTLLTNYSVNASDANYFNGGSMIACKAANDCAIVYSSTSTPSATAKVMSFFFNTTRAAPPVVLRTAGYITAYCAPSIPVIAVSDYDLDGDIEFIYSIGFYEMTSGHLQVGLGWLSSDGGDIAQERVATYTASTLIATSCTLISSKFNAPLVYDTDTDTGIGERETMFAAVTGGQNFRLFRYSSAGVALTEYPSALFNGCADVVSNMFLGDAFATIPSFCAVGFSASGCTGAAEMLCGNELVGWGTLNYNFRSVVMPYTSQTINVSLAVAGGQGPYYNIVHSVYMDTSTAESDYNYKEISTIEGILRLDDRTSTEVLNPIFRFGKGNVSHSIVNLEGKTRPEIALLQTGTAYYLSDSFTNNLPNLGDVTQNPCFTSPIKVNSSVYVSMAVSDQDSFIEGDTISARAQFYLGETFEQDSNWTAEQPSGSDIPFYFTANRTISTSILRLSYRDSAEPTSVKTKDFTFSVAANGVTFGFSCVVNTNASALATNTTESIFGVTKDPLANNAVSEVVAQTAKSTGLGTTLVWYVFMIALALLIFYGAVELKIQSGEMRYIYGLIAFIEVGMVLIGVKLGFVPVATLIVLVILGIIVVGITLSRRVTSN